MNFYIDIEATQPENEIIAIGVVAGNGSKFYSLVKPQFSSISQHISELTQITQEDLETAKTINEVLISLDWWIENQEKDIMKCNFISYGEDDKFFKATLPVITDDQAFTLAAIIMAKLENHYETTRKFFHGPIKLIHAFNYVQSAKVEQKHNPLDDAIMLQVVYEYMQSNEPLPCHPLNNRYNEPTTPVKMPSGTFWCKHANGGKNGKIRNFATCDEAIDWLIGNVIQSKEPEKIHRERIMANIMKAIRKNGKYCNYCWGRVKEEGEKEENN